MTCEELQRILPDVIDGGRSAEQEAHLKSCAVCSGLVSDLRLISQQARLLQASEEPSPRVWNSIEMGLRQEGLIRQPQREPVLVRTSRRWSPAWLLPVAAVLLIAFWVVRSQSRPGQSQMAEGSRSAAAVTADLQPGVFPANADEDQQLLAAVGTSSPATRASYEANLQDVNAYIRDAATSVANDPNDEEARQSLMEAYDQRAMVYEMAMDRSLP
jgi:hypothetical protein